MLLEAPAMGSYPAGCLRPVAGIGLGIGDLDLGDDKGGHGRPSEVPGQL